MTEGRRVRRQSFLQRTAIWIPAGVIGLLMLPLAVTSRTYGDDWTLHLWLIRQQQMNIQANGRPGLFLSASPLGAFYPIFAFVGSGIYTVGAYLAILLGDRPILAYKLMYLGALCLAYGGMTWLSRQMGLQGWRSQMPGLVFVTGSYFVTDMFGHGDLGELTALSAIPFLIAAITAVTMSKRLNPGYLLAVALGVFVFTGSHNVTLLYGTIFLTLLVLVLLCAHTPSSLSRLPWLRLPAMLVAAAIGAGLNAWYLLADLKYSLGTRVALDTRAGVKFGLSGWWLLLNPLRPSDPSYNPADHDLRLSLPWLFAAWAIVVAVLVWRRIDDVGRRLIVLLTALAALYVYLLVARRPWRSLPHILYTVQFPIRLHAYVLLATTLLVMVVLVWQAGMNAGTRRATSAALGVVAVFTVGVATWQAWVVPSTFHEEVFATKLEERAPHNLADIVVAARFTRPKSFYPGGDFRDLTGHVIQIGYAHQITIPESQVRGSTFTGRVYGAGGGAFRTNIAAGENFVQITGIEPIGITASGFIVAERLPGTPRRGPIDVTIRQAQTRVLRRGAFISKVSLYALAALVAWAVCAWLWPWLWPRLQPIPLPPSDARARRAGST